MAIKYQIIFDKTTNLWYAKPTDETLDVKDWRIDYRVIHLGRPRLKAVAKAKKLGLRIIKRYSGKLGAIARCRPHE